MSRHPAGQALLRMLAEAAVRVSTIATQIVAARALAPRAYGAYVLLVSSFGLIIRMSDFSLPVYVMRDASRGHTIHAMLPRVLWLRAKMLVAATALAVTTALWAHLDAPLTAVFGLLIAAVCGSLAEFLGAMLVGVGLSSRDGRLAASGALVTAVASIGGVWLYGLSGLAIGTALGSAAMLAAYFAACRTVEKATAAPATGTYRIERGDFAATATAGAAGMVHDRIGTLCVGAWLGESAAGDFSIAWRIVALVVSVSWIGSQPLVSASTRAASWLRLAAGSMTALAAAGAVAGAALWWAAPFFIPAVFGEEHRAAAEIMRQLAPLLPALLPAAVIPAFLIAAGRERLAAWLLGVGALAKMGAYALLLAPLGLSVVIAGEAAYAVLALGAAALLLLRLFQREVTLAKQK